MLKLSPSFSCSSRAARIRFGCTFFPRLPFCVVNDAGTEHELWSYQLTSNRPLSIAFAAFPGGWSFFHGRGVIFNQDRPAGVGENVLRYRPINLINLDL